MITHLPIGLRLLLFLLLLSVLPIALLGGGFLNAFQEAQLASATSHLGEMADKKGQQIREYLEERRRDVRLLAARDMVTRDLRAFTTAFQHGGTEDAAYRTLYRERVGVYADFIRTAGYYDLFLVDLEGDVAFSVAREADFGSNLHHGPLQASGLAEAVNHALTLLEPGVSEMAFYAPSREGAVFLAAPVVVAERLAGAVALQVDTSRFREVVGDTTGLGESGETVTARREGDAALFLLPLRHDPRAAFNRRVPLGDPLAAPIQRAIRGEHGQGLARDYRGVPVLAAWRYLPQVGMGMVVKTDTAEALAAAHRLRLQGEAVVLAILALVLLAAWWVGRSLVLPIRHLTGVADQLAAGQLAQRATLGGRDELGRLAVAFNTMAERLQADQARLEQRVRERTAELERINHRLQLAGIVFDNSSEAVVVTDATSRILDVNPAYCRITGFSRQEALGNTPRISKSGHHDDAFYQAMWRDLIDKGQWAGEIWDRRKNGDVYPKWLAISAVRDAAGEITHYVGIFSDITEQKETAERLERLAFYDPLTGLPNRALFQDRLRQEMHAARRHGNQLALLYLDLDRFKWVNDTLGHAAGDELLREVAQRLTGAVRHMDTVARLGGDEFTIIFTEVDHGEQVADLAREIIGRIKRPIPLQGREVHVGVSIGIALFPEDGHDRETLSKHADMAMYQAKEAGRLTFRFFSPDIHALAFDRITLEDDLHKALDGEQLELHYQPKVAAADGRLLGMEALVRWQQPAGEMVNPGHFIPLAEETGLIIPMGGWILRRACHQTAAWNRDGGPPLTVAVNLSARQFQHQDLVSLVRETLAESGLEPRRLELEITESMVMGNVEEAVATMRRLRDLGVGLAIDDFGTGYSSLNHLKRFPITTLKIDQSFVRDLTLDSEDAAIVEAIISMAHSLRLTVVAEGVETAQQFSFLQERGCSELQGYLISRPLPAAAFQDYRRTQTQQG